MFRTLLLSFLAVSVVSTISYAGSVSTWDAYADFSIVNNPNGAWAYGYSLTNNPGLSFVASNNHGVVTDGYRPFGVPAEYDGVEMWTTDTFQPMIARNPSGVDKPGPWNTFAANALTMHPANGDPEGPVAVVQWTAPSSMNVNLTGSFFRSSGQFCTIDGYVEHNGVVIWTGNVSDATLTQNFNFSNYAVSANDTLSFVLGDHGNNGGDLTSFNATINAVPEPASIALLSSGLIGLAAAARRKHI